MLLNLGERQLPRQLGDSGRAALVEEIGSENDDENRKPQKDREMKDPLGAVAAGLATLELLEEEGVYETLASRASELAHGLAEIASEIGIPLISRSVGGMFGFFFHAGPVESFDDAQKSDVEAFRRFFAAMLEEGIYLAPSAYEAGFVSLAHRPRDIAETLDAARRALRKVARSR